MQQVPEQFNQAPVAANPARQTIPTTVLALTVLLTVLGSFKTYFPTKIFEITFF